ncbi:uncharacterized short protein YbdD (DUF466 family) [Sphingobium fontiphilum]|uniref:Uncharacterized short protein YbdD (DUF466 family) n=1 Tax=Sphingobium fontiphilum TaxID=944425 RepID=A0A7W6GQC1_9SPHN|nr:YbdD/YjiX family protein [Sphingobium fontiphilum]MBB3983358.1 uncharacterized short protein YbdD (DUF466 family) [Sphingobium fontiphilum]
MSLFLEKLRHAARMMVGMPDYDAYLRHMRDHHPEQEPMDRVQFFRDRQESRYGGKNGGKCC